MKIKYYLLSLAMASAVIIGFSSCSDDNDTTVNPTAPVEDLVFGSDVQRIKIGAENRMSIDIVSGNGEYNAYSLNPDVADVVTGDDGTIFIEGFKNGIANIVISDAENQYKRLIVSVYTTDVLQLSHESYEFNCPLGLSASTADCYVALGNGGYTIESDNPNVNAIIEEETGEIILTATAKKADYNANITVKDCSGLTGTIAVTVKASLIGFTDSEIADIKAKTESTLYGACKDPSDGNTPYYYNWYKNNAWIDQAVDNGIYRLGWWYRGEFKGSSSYGGLSIDFPETAQINEEVEGTLYFQYSYILWYDCYEYTGTVKVLENDNTRIVAIFWNVDLVNERINRAYFVHYK